MFLCPVESRFFAPAMISKSAAHRSCQDWPRATAEGGLVLTASSTAQRLGCRADHAGCPARAGRCQASPEVRTAQAILAVLAAWASTATFMGRRARMPRCHAVARSEDARALRMTVLAPSASSLRSRLSPFRLMPARWRFPPLECSRGVNPAQSTAQAVLLALSLETDSRFRFIT